MLVLGLDAVTAENTGSTASPAWTIIEKVRDETLNLTKALSDVTTRKADGWRQQVGTLKEGSVDLQVLYSNDKTDNDTKLFRDSFLNNQMILMGFFDGDPSAAGSVMGLAGGFECTEHTFNRELEEAIMVDVTLTVREDDEGNGPKWMEITNP